MGWQFDPATMKWTDLPSAPYPEQVVMADSSSGPFTMTIPASHTVTYDGMHTTYHYSTTVSANTTGTPAKQEAEPDMTTATAKTVAYDFTFTGGPDVTVKGSTVDYSDGIVVVRDEKGRPAAFFNQEIVKGFVPVTDEERPTETVGRYTYRIELEDGGDDRTVTADSYDTRVIAQVSDDALAQTSFVTRLASGVERTELTLDAAAIKAIVRVEADAPAKRATKKAASPTG